LHNITVVIVIVITNVLITMTMSRKCCKGTLHTKLF